MVPQNIFSKEFLRFKIYSSDLVELHSLTMKKSGIPFLLGLIFLVLFGVQGAPIMRNDRCSCISTRQGKIHPKALKDIKQFAPSPSCEKTEIIATMKNGNEECLNPDSGYVKKLVKMWKEKVSQKKKQKKGGKQKMKTFLKAKRPQRPHQKKTT
ncbi:C-X-C motif chemokine 9 [Marmota monax]|uniref:C-X-C motif chemokine n=1 Tax=Marmota monax TaxID=9995 RepID=A0A834QVP8_MARMO|nr:C-X-C motif chemokine 9 [Marmota monax]